MQRPWQEFRTSWRGTPWSFSLLLTLLPFAVIVALAIDIASGRVHIPPKDVPAVATGVSSFLLGTITGRYGGRLRQRLKQLVAVARSHETAPRPHPDQGRTRLAGQKGGQAGRHR